jgi:hypothetical protein
MVIIISYSAAERESVLQSDDESGIWKLSTYQSKVINKLKRVNVEPIEILSDGQHKYELDFSQVSFRSGKKRVMSEKNRIAASERAKKNFHSKGEIE